MTATWYAIVEHVGSTDDLIGREVTIEAVRMFVSGIDSHDVETLATLANGRAWCRVVPNGSQVPTRGSIMRVYSDLPLGYPHGVMLSADEMLERVKSERDALAEALREMTSERDRWQGEAERWRDRAADRDAFDMYEDRP